MEKGEKTLAAWMMVARGTAVALIVYLAGAALLAVLLVEGKLPESAAFPVMLALCGIAAVTGGGLCVRKTAPSYSLPMALGCGASLMGCILCVGACWNGICWTGQTAALGLCALGGSLAVGMAGKRKRRKGKRRRKMGKL